MIFGVRSIPTGGAHAQPSEQFKPRWKLRTDNRQTDTLRARSNAVFHDVRVPLDAKQVLWQR
jgi:hypothetical protein